MSVPQKGHFWRSALSHLTVSLICLPHLKHVISSGKLSKNIFWFYKPPASGQSAEFKLQKKTVDHKPRRRDQFEKQRPLRRLLYKRSFALRRDPARPPLPQTKTKVC